MLRNKEPELAENIDSSFGCFELGFYRVSFVFGSRHPILVHREVSSLAIIKTVADTLFLVIQNSQTEKIKIFFEANLKDFLIA